MSEPHSAAWSPAPRPAGDPPPKGPYTPAVRAGPFVFVSGQVPRDPVTGDLAGESIEAQSQLVLANVARVLAAAGAGLGDVVSVTVYLTDVEDWEAFNVVYRQHFQEPYPTRTAVGASLRGIRVEVSAVAYAPR